jgi:hypothetical protein
MPGGRHPIASTKATTAIAKVSTAPFFFCIHPEPATMSSRDLMSCDCIRSQLKWQGMVMMRRSAGG